MEGIVTRNVRKEVNNRAKSDDIADRVQVKVKAQLDEMVASKVQERYAADDLVGRVQVNVKAQLDEMVTSKVKKKYAADDILLSKILADARLVQQQLQRSSSSKQKRPVFCVEPRTTKPKKKSHKADHKSTGEKKGEPEADPPHRSSRSEE
ncbi:hypothetical protein PF008_g13242 [Phytophthora fragariae]|uniref:Uncharacterized protein n=1 Tax=Phytophthora fragariae TaxID=53985 RepID=A0A6G0RLZ0_9STRA|nr:hypothetical protein PF008_g13242 [Phytophthora fragariae]